MYIKKAKPFEKKKKIGQNFKMLSEKGNSYCV